MKKITKLKILTCAVISITWIACAWLHASECPGPREPGRDMRERKTSSEASGMSRGSARIVIGGVANAAIEDTQASYGLTCGALELNAGPVAGAFKMMRFSWDSPNDYVVDTKGRDPWGDLYEASIQVKHGGAVAGNFRYGLMLGAASAFEDQADDSFSFQCGAHAIYPLHPKWTLVAGVLYSKHQTVESDFEFIPVASLSWNMDAKSGPSFTIGLPKTEISWRFNKDTAVTLDTDSFESGIYRLASDNPARKEGYVEFTGASCTLRVDTVVLDRIQISAGVSYTLVRKHALYDHDGNNELEYDAEKRPGLIFSVSAPF